MLAAVNECKIVSKGAKIRNRYNQVPHLTQDTSGKVANLQLDATKYFSVNLAVREGKVFLKVLLLNVVFADCCHQYI